MDQALALVDYGSVQGHFAAYCARVHAIAMLTEQEEKTLAARWFEHHDLDAARQLTLAHLRYVIRVAKGYQGYGLALPDLVQEGNIGLMQAVKRFNPHVGVRLVTFAAYWIRAHIHEYIIKNWRIVKVATTKAQRKLFFKLRSAKQRLAWFSEDDVRAVAEDLQVSPKDVREMEQRLYATDPALDGESDDDDAAHWAPSQVLASPTASPEQQLLAQQDQAVHATQLALALEALSERELHIIQSRWLADDKKPLKALAEQYQISIERVRQLEKAALQKMQRVIAA